ncbi:MAG: hypothetical protein KZQ65_10995, partial [Candidatus Thiodiazotropha sp. (ex Gloverina cf. vestifex)]|nr:hypothetical protein [Candidatus Thiodiazotropha sp. (ex Gloverina cf. vestifex)]
MIIWIYFDNFVRQKNSRNIVPANKGGIILFYELLHQACRYLVKDFGTSESPKSTRQRDSRYAPT